MARSSALRECDGAERLLARRLPRWLAHWNRATTQRAVCAAAARAGAAFEAFRSWLTKRRRADGIRGDTPSAPGCFDLLLARGHWCDRSRAALLGGRRSDALDEALATLERRARRRSAGGWPEVQAAPGRRASDRRRTTSPPISAIWDACRDARDRGATSSPGPTRPIRYVPIPAQTRDAAPFLYYLFYRSPAPFDRLPVHDYVVTPIDADMAPDEQLRRLRATNTSVIKLNHVVHHGAHRPSRAEPLRLRRRRREIGRVAAVDCASRIGMFLGGTMAEGWACYATDLMDEIGFLTPDESLPQQHTRARLLARAVVDIGLHERLADASTTRSRVYRDRVGMSAGGGARPRPARTRCFPAPRVMYWLGHRRAASPARASASAPKGGVLAAALSRPRARRSARSRCRCWQRVW